MSAAPSASFASRTHASFIERKKQSKDCTISLITRRPCVTCVSMLVLAVVLGGIGFALNEPKVGLDGWSTRGTTISKAFWPYDLYSEPETSTATPDAPPPEADFDPNANPDPTGPTGPTGPTRRRLLQDENNDSAPTVDTCAVKDAENKEYTVSYNDINVILSAKSGVDLFSPEAMADACEFFEGTMMKLDGYSSRCARDDTCTLPLPTGDNVDEGWKWWSKNSENYSRCQRAFGYATYFYSTKGYASCSDYRTNSALQAQLATAKASLLTCAAAKASDANAECTTDEALPYNAAALDTFFGVGGVTDATQSRYYLPSQGLDVTYWYDAYTAGSISFSSNYFTVSWDYSSNDLRDEYVDSKLMADMVLALSAILVILVLMWVHTGSIVLTVGGVLQILMAFPSALFLTSALCDFSFFPFLNFIGIFIIAGIGADDCFVMYDKWMMAKYRCLPGANSRVIMEKCYWESAWAMFLTSFTTAAAFFSNAITPIAPIRVFAIFMGGMVLFDYFYDITIFAALLCWQHDVLIKHDKNSATSWMLDFWGSLRRLRAIRKIDAGESEPKAVQEGDVIDSKRDTRSPEEKFLGEKVFPVVYKLRWVLVILFCGVFSGGMYGALQIDTPQDSEVQLLDDSHMFTQFSYHSRNSFKSSSESQVWVSVIWGVKAVDNGDHYEPTSKGTIEYDSTFDMSSIAAQNWLVTFCSDTANNMAYKGASECWMSTFDTWLGQQSVYASTESPQLATDYAANCRSVDGGNATALPIAPDKFYDCLYTFSKSQPGVNNVQRPLSNAFDDSSGKQRLTILEVQFGLQETWSAPVGDLEKAYGVWEDYVTKKIADAPEGLKNGYQTCGAWSWMDTVTSMRDGAYLAAATTLAISAVTTLVSTQNFVVVLYSVFAILTILVSVVSTIVGMGWTLGFLEGICLVILIGLSVDYVLHIGHAYAHAARQRGATRQECARHAIATMGFPVLSAAFTTLISALFLLRATVVFFVKFGTVTVLSSVFSSIVSVVLFVALLAAAGPTNGFGDFSRLFSKKRLEKSASLY